MLSKSLLPTSVLAIALAGILAFSVSPQTQAQQPVPPTTTERQIANDLVQAFPGQVDLFLATDKDFELGRPSLADVKIVGCKVIASLTYYVVRHNNGSDSFIPQTQIIAIHNRK